MKAEPESDTRKITLLVPSNRGSAPPFGPQRLPLSPPQFDFPPPQARMPPPPPPRPEDQSEEMQKDPHPPIHHPFFFSSILKTFPNLPPFDYLKSKMQGGILPLPPKEEAMKILQQSFQKIVHQENQVSEAKEGKDKEEMEKKEGDPMAVPHMKKWPILKIFMTRLRKTEMDQPRDIQEPQGPEMEKPEWDMARRRPERPQRPDRWEPKDREGRMPPKQQGWMDHGPRDRGPFREGSHEDEEDEFVQRGFQAHPPRRGHPKKSPKQMDLNTYQSKHFNNVSPKNKFTLLQVFVNKKPEISHQHPPMKYPQPQMHHMHPSPIHHGPMHHGPMHQGPMPQGHMQQGPMRPHPMRHPYPMHSIPNTIPPYHPQIGPNLYLNYHPFFPHMKPTLSRQPPWRVIPFRNPSNYQHSAEESKETELYVSTESDDDGPSYACLLPLDAGMCKTYQVSALTCNLSCKCSSM